MVPPSETFLPNTSLADITSSACVIIVNCKQNHPTGGHHSQPERLQVTQSNPVLSSDVLTSLEQNLTKQRASGAHWREETWRLTKLLSPASCYDQTSETAWDPELTTKARIGLLKTTMKKAAPVTNDGHEAARLEAIKKNSGR